MQPSHAPRDAGRALAVTPQAVRGWCRQYGIGVRVGGRWRIPAEAVELIGRGIPLAEVAARVRPQ